MRNELKYLLYLGCEVGDQVNLLKREYERCFNKCEFII